MNKYTVIFNAVAVLFIAAMVYCLFVGCNRQGIALQKLNLYTLNGELVNWDTLKGKTIVANFWATWCGPCLQEKPFLEQARLALEKEGVVFLTISEEDTTTIAQYKNQKKYGFTYLKSDNNFKMLGIFSIPQTYSINKEGKVIHSQLGGRNWANPESLDLIRQAL